MAEIEETERLIRTARVRSRALDEALEGEDFKKVVQEAYNVMFLAARATVNHLGATAASHRAVASIYRKDLIGRQLLNKKYKDHLRKITQYRNGMLSGEGEEIDAEKAAKIVEACKDLVRVLNDLIKNNPEPVIDYDITDYA